MKYSKLFLFGAATISLINSMPSTAQSSVPSNENSSESTDITVTGQRQQYVAQVPIIEVPSSIQVLNGQTLRDAGITRLDNALDFASGIARQNNLGGLFDSFACRGFAGDENRASNYLVNGFNSARGYGGPRDTSNVERVEVLKGPQSSLFGRGEPGCTINIVSKKPYFETGGNATLSYGSYDTFRGEGDINLALTSRIAMRVTGAYEDGDTYRGLHTQKYTFTPSFLAQLGSDSSLSYELEYIYQEVPFDRGVIAIDGDLSALPRDRFLGEPGDGPNTVEALGHQVQLQHDFDSNWSLILGAGYRETSLKGYSTEVENAASRQYFLVDGTTVSRQRRYRAYDTSDLTFRGELSGEFRTAGIEHHILLGADWNDFEQTIVIDRYRPSTIASQSATDLSSGNRVNVFAPVYGNLPAVSPLQNYTERQFAYGFYLQDQIDVTDALKLRLGGRYDDFEQRIGDHITATTSRQHETAFSPSIGATYLLGDSLSIYANYGRGFRPNSGFNYLGVPFAPEKTTSYELGTKLSLLGNRLTGTLALFKTDKTNVLTADPVNSPYSIAAGRAKSKGVEFELSGSLRDDIRVQFNYSYIDAEVGDDSIDPNFGYSLLKGDPLLNIPKHSASALVFKDFDIGESKLTLGAGVNYVGKRLGETGFRYSDGSFFMLPDYTLVRVTASFEPVEGVKISGEVTNLFNEKYSPSSYSRYWVMPGAPRQYMVRVGYKF